MTNQGGFSNSTPFVALRRALNDLQQFTTGNADAEIPNLSNLAYQEEGLVHQEQSRLSKVFCLARQLFSQEHIDQNRRVRVRLVESIETIRTHSPLLVKLLDGSDEERHFAEQALNIIESYNTLLSHHNRMAPTWSRQLASMIYQSGGWLACDQILGNAITLPKAERQSATDNNSGPTDQEATAFRMKAISLLTREGFPLPLRDAMRTIRETPIRSTGSSNGVFSFSQVVQLENQEIRLHGSFKRIDDSRFASIPIPESFRVSKPWPSPVDE